MVFTWKEENDSYIIESFGNETGVSLVDYLSRHPEITKLVVKCPIPDAMKVKGLDITGSKISYIIFEQGRNNLPVRRAPEHKVIITDKTIVNLSGNKRSADAQPEIQPRATPSIATSQVSSTSSTSQFVLAASLARPTNQPPKPIFELPKPVQRPATSLPRPILSTPAPLRTPAKPVVQRSVEKTASDTRYASTSDLNKPAVKSVSKSTQLIRNLSDADLQILAAMGYSKEDFEELVKKEYDLEKVSALLKPVLERLLIQRASGYNKARLHQIVGLSEFIDALADNKPNALFEYATGSGKTFMFTQLASAYRGAYPNKNVVILVPTQLLRTQTIEAFREFAPVLQVTEITSGKELDAAQNRNNSQVHVMSYQLAMTGNNKEKAQALLSDSSVVIMDEAHYSLPYVSNNEDIQKVLARTPTLAFTATPEFNLKSAARAGLNDVNKLIGYDRLEGNNPISKFNVVPAILSKANCPVKCLVVFPEGQNSLSEQKISDNLVNANVSGVINTEANNRMVADILLNGKDANEHFRFQKAIGFCSGTQHADDMVALINGIPNIVEIVDPNGVMRMQYALNIFAKKMSDAEYKIGEVERLVSAIIYSTKDKASAELMQQEIHNCISTARGRPENIETVSNAISECIGTAYANFKVASAVHSKKDKKEEPNEEELEQYKLGGTRFLFGDQMLIAGFDDPATSIILNINPTASEPAAIQRAGRGLRLDKNNPNKVCKIIDFDWGIRQQRLFYEYLGNDQNGNPNLHLGDLPALPAPMQVEPVVIENKAKYSVVKEYQGGQIEISHKTLRKQQRQQEEVDKVRKSKMGVVLEASLTKFNETLKVLEVLKQKLAQKLNRGESVVVDESSSTEIKKRSRSEDDDNSEERKVKKARKPRQTNSVVMQGRYTRNLSKQITENVKKAEGIIDSINEFFETLDLDTNSLSAPSNSTRSSSSSKKGGTSIYEVNMDSELQKFTSAARNLNGMVQKLQGMMKLNTLVTSSAVATTSMQSSTSATIGDEYEARNALVGLIESMNSIQNSSILEDKNIDELIAHSKKKKQELEEQKKQEELKIKQAAEAAQQQRLLQLQQQQAAEAKKAEELRQAEHGKNAEQVEKDPLFAQLFQAASEGNVRDIEMLYRAGLSLEAKGNNGFTPLYRAAMNGQVEAIQKLKDLGANLEAKTNNGNTPLHVAAQRGQVEVIQKLKDLGANLEAKNISGDTPLHVAAMHGEVEVIQKLKDLGANLEAKTSNGFTPLHVAAQYGRVEAIQKLKDLGVNLDAKDNNGNTTLEIARHNLANSKLILLVEQAMSRQTQQSSAVAPTSAVSAPIQQPTGNDDDNDVEIVPGVGAEKPKLNIAFGLDNVHRYLNQSMKDATDIYGNTPLMYLSKSGAAAVRTNLFPRLLALKPNIDAVSQADSYTALHFAAMNVKDTDNSLATQLLNHGSDVSKRSKAGHTALHLACNIDKPSLARLLLKKDENLLSIQNNSGQTAMHIAVCKHSVSYVKALLDNCHNFSFLNLRNNNGETALDSARQSQIFPEIIQLLEQAMSGQSQQSSAVASTSAISAPVQQLTSNDDNDDVEIVRSSESKQITAPPYFTRDNIIEYISEEHINIRDGKGNTPLMHLALLAPIGRNLQVFSRLLALKPDLNATSPDGYTALHFAATNTKDTDNYLATKLLNHGANVSKRNKAGYTALHLACERGKPSLARLLLKKDVSLMSIQNNIGQTAMHIAVCNHSVSCVKALLDNCHDFSFLNLKENSGKTALDKARVNQVNPEIIHLLEQAMSGQAQQSSAVASTSAVSAPQLRLSDPVSRPFFPNQSLGDFASSFAQQPPAQLSQFGTSTAISTTTTNDDDFLPTFDDFDCFMLDHSNDMAQDNNNLDLFR